MKRICQHCSRWYDDLNMRTSRYCDLNCRLEAKRQRQKTKRDWEHTQKTLTLEQRKRELDEIFGKDEYELEQTSSTPS